MAVADTVVAAAGVHAPVVDPIGFAPVAVAVVAVSVVVAPVVVVDLVAFAAALAAAFGAAVVAALGVAVGVAALGAALHAAGSLAIKPPPLLALSFSYLLPCTLTGQRADQQDSGPCTIHEHHVPS